MLDKKLVWQPISLYGEGYNFGIILDRKFAEEMLLTKINTDIKIKMDELARKLVPKNFNPHLQFYLDTALVDQFDLGSGGKWLAFDGTYGKNPLEVFADHIKYSSHNIDLSKEAYDLMSLVDFWVEYSDVLKDLVKKA